MQLVSVAPLLVVAAAVLADAAHGWTLAYGARAPRTVTGAGDRACRIIDLPAGGQFRWDRGRTESCCVRLYANNRCSGPVRGISCLDATKRTPVRLLSYRVNC
jgi:hypothetical protein